MKKSKFLTFILSIIPGCGLMYLGYMKRGIQTTTMFALCIYLSFTAIDLLQFQWLAVFFVALLPLIWLYQFFDSMHSISRMKKWEIEIPSDDEFFFPETIQPISIFKNEKIIKGIGASLVFIGIYMIIFNTSNSLYNMFHDYPIVRTMYFFFRHYFIPSVMAVLLIFSGFKLLRR